MKHVLRLVRCWVFPGHVFRVLYRERCYFRVEYPMDESLRVCGIVGADRDATDFRSLRAFAVFACGRLAEWDNELRPEGGGA